MPLFVIEHLELRVYSWCKLEYQHISNWVGKSNLLFTNTSNTFLKTIGRVEKKKAKQLTFEKACVLDPEALLLLTPEIANKFKTFIFGGILGDDPPQERTKVELSSSDLQYPRFNLGKEQMSTDTAVIVTKKIVDGTQLEKLSFQQGIDIEINDSESVCLPYKYLVVHGKPLLAPGLVEKLKTQKGF